MGPCLSNQTRGEVAFRKSSDSLETMSAKMPLMKSVSTPLPLRRNRGRDSSEPFKSRLERPVTASFGFKRQISVPQATQKPAQSLESPPSNEMNVSKQAVIQSDSNSNYSSTTSSEGSKLPTMPSKLKPPSSFKRCLSQDPNTTPPIVSPPIIPDTNGNTKHSSRLVPPQVKSIPKVNIPSATNELLLSRLKAPTSEENMSKSALKPATSPQNRSKSQEVVARHVSHDSTSSLENTGSPHTTPAFGAKTLGLKKPEHTKNAKHTKLRPPKTSSKSASTHTPIESSSTSLEHKVKTTSSHLAASPESVSSREDSGVSTTVSHDGEAKEEPSSIPSAPSTSHPSKRSHLTLRYMPKVSSMTPPLANQRQSTTATMPPAVVDDGQPCAPLKVHDAPKSQAEVYVGFVQHFQLYPSQAEMAILTPTLDFDQQQGVLLEEISPMDYPSSMSSSCDSSSVGKDGVTDGLQKTTHDGASSPTPTSYSEGDQNFLIDDEIADQPELMLYNGRDGDLLQPSNLHLRLCAVRSDSKDTLSPCESLASDEIEWSEQQRVLRHRNGSPEPPQQLDINLSPLQNAMRSPCLPTLTQLGLSPSDLRMGTLDARLEELDRGYLAQDVAEIKAMLLKLKLVLEDAETVSPFSPERGALYRRMAANNPPRDTNNHCQGSNDVGENLDLKRQLVLVQEQLEDKTRAVKNLQQQLKIAQASNQSKDKNSKKINVATQTDRPRVNVTEALSRSPSSDDVLGPLVSCKEKRIESTPTKKAAPKLCDAKTLDCPEKKPHSMSPRKPIPTQL